MSKDIHQTDCRDCGAEIFRDITGEDHIICPYCGAKLNQYSSEDASEYIGVTKWYPPQGSYNRLDYLPEQGIRMP